MDDRQIRAVLLSVLVLVSAGVTNVFLYVEHSARLEAIAQRRTVLEARRVRLQQQSPSADSLSDSALSSESSADIMTLHQDLIAGGDTSGLSLGGVVEALLDQTGLELLSLRPSREGNPEVAMEARGDARRVLSFIQLLDHYRPALYAQRLVAIYREDALLVTLSAHLAQYRPQDLLPSGEITDPEADLPDFDSVLEDLELHRTQADPLSPPDFEWRVPAPHVTPRSTNQPLGSSDEHTEAPGPQRASWLSFVGRIVGAQGTTEYYFLDSRSGRVLSSATGGPVEVIAENAATFTIRYNGELYDVSR